MRTRSTLLLTLAAAAVASTGVGAQSLYLPLPADSIESLLRYAPVSIEDLTGTRFENDRTDTAHLRFDGGATLMAKVAPAPEGGDDPDEHNNRPRYEVAAYEFQKLFLDEGERVVPPTVLRAFPFDEYRALDREVEATFRGASSVVVLLQAWLNFVTGENAWDEERLEVDSTYARYWANLNLFTYLIRHNDANVGNLQISVMETDPRVFAVDNGFAFNSVDSDRGTTWRRLQVDRFPATTVERLRRLTEEDLHRTLGVLAQWEVRDEELVPVPTTENIDARRGVRQRDGVVQMGLTRDEIDDTWYRLEVFLRQIDSGVYTTF